MSSAARRYVEDDVAVARAIVRGRQGRAVWGRSLDARGHWWTLPSLPVFPLLGISPLVLRPCLPRNLISTANICESPEIKLCPLAVRDQSGQIHLPPFLCQANQGEIMMGGREGGPWATKPLWAPLNRVRVRWHLLNSLALVLNRGGLSWGCRLQDLPGAVS